MAKAVFRSAELIVVPDKVMINTPTPFLETETFVPVSPEEEVDTGPFVEEYTGPTAEELRQEADAFRVQWEAEKTAMIQSAQDEADAIRQAAMQFAEQEKQQTAENAEVQKIQAQAEVETILAEARQKAEDAVAEARKNLESERQEALEKGREEGHAEGYANGKAEVDRLIERTQLVLERAQDKRGEILVETEKEIISLVLLIARKIVKVISESQRDVVVSNVLEALRKVRTRGTVIIRVNLSDLKLATEYTKEFIEALEGGSSIQVMEDSTVDPGGCIIETDFGEIDARISSQLAELESRILEISPIKSKVKSLPRES